MAETLALTDHEKLLSGPSAVSRRAPGDTYAIPENEYQKQILLGQTSANAATARTNRAGQLSPRADGK